MTTNSQILPSDAAKELLRRREIRRDLTKVAQHIGLEPALHHRLIIDEIEALIETKDYDTLLIFAPPGSAKSTYVSIALPTWYIGRFPSNSILHASHSTTLAEKWGRRIRNIIEEHSKILGVRLADDSKAAGRWATDKGGEYYAVGAGVGIAGFRADCVTGETKVDTPQGVKRIDALSLDQDCYVLSYERQIRRPVYRKVLAIARRKTNELWRIRTAYGCVVESTGEHRFYTERGWIKASALSVGDVLLCEMPGDWASSSSRDAQTFGQASILRSRMFNESGKLGSWVRRSKVLQWLWQAASSTSKASSRVFEAMSQHCRAAIKSQANSGAAMYRLFDNIHSAQFQAAWKILFSRLQGYRACASDSWFCKSKLAGWPKSFALSGREWAEIQICQAESDEARQGLLRHMRQFQRTTGASHRQGQHEQRPYEYRDPMCHVPLQASCCGAQEIATDYVAMVERVCKESFVYDIQVEETACFFANGVLVHNCGIIDDPFGSREDADSDTIREKIIDWFQADFSARLKPGAKRVVMHTRWREDDLAGYIITEAQKGKYRIKVISLPAVANPGDPLGRRPGDYLWDEPDGYNYGDFLRTRQKEVSTRDWSALYQQSPAPDEGLYFKKEWFRYYDVLPQHLRNYGASDYAVTAKGGDYTVHVVIGVDPHDNLYIADIWRQQADSNIWVDAFCDLIDKYKPLMWAGEQGQIFKSLGPFINKRMLERRSYCALEEFTSLADKPTRARSFQARMAMGKVYMPTHASWLADFERELLSFPAGVHDDIVDALGLTGRLLDTMAAAHVPVTPIPDHTKDYSGRDEKDAADDWKTV